MTKQLATWYGALFLFDQLLGVATALSGIFAPNFDLYWLHSSQASLVGLAMISASLAFPVLIWKQILPKALFVLPAYHLGGLLLMQAYVSSAAHDLLNYGWFLTEPNPALAANFATLQEFDVTIISLGHSLIGLIIGSLMLVILRRYPLSERTS